MDADITRLPTDEEIMAACAIRYTLGRRSYLVAEGVRWARKYAAQSKWLRDILIRDIEERIERKIANPSWQQLGDATDEQKWREVLAEMKAMAG